MTRSVRAALRRKDWALGPFSQIVVRHAIVGGAGIGLIYLFWLTRPQWDPEMRFWKAVGDASLMFLYATLAMGPIARLLPSIGRVVLLRREVGVWFGLFALLHTFLILNGWVRWDIMRFLGYEFIPELGRFVRLESGFGLANIMGIVAIVITLPLMGTSTDWAIQKLGGNAWKFLHSGSYIIFWLVVLHTAYFLFIQYAPHFHRPTPPLDWFRYPFLMLTVTVIGLQVAGFLVTVKRRLPPAPESSTPPRVRPTRR